MKKVLVVACVVALGILAYGVAGAQFGNIKVPTSTSDVKSNFDQVEYDQCNNIAKSLDNNTKINSSNIKQELDSKKNVTYLKTSKDWTISKNDSDKKNKVLDIQYKCMTKRVINANCTYEKCYVSSSSL